MRRSRRTSKRLSTSRVSTRLPARVAAAALSCSPTGKWTASIWRPLIRRRSATWPMMAMSRPDSSSCSTARPAALSCSVLIGLPPPGPHPRHAAEDEVIEEQAKMSAPCGGISHLPRRPFANDWSTRPDGRSDGSRRTPSAASGRQIVAVRAPVTKHQGAQFGLDVVTWLSVATPGGGADKVGIADGVTGRQ